MLEMHHNSELAAHQGHKRVIAQITDAFFWPAMAKDAINWVRAEQQQNSKQDSEDAIVTGWRTAGRTKATMANFRRQKQQTAHKMAKSRLHKQGELQAAQKHRVANCRLHTHNSIAPANKGLIH